jgi:DNA topoisomerase II
VSKKDAAVLFLHPQVLFACFKKRLTKDMKVAQLCGYIAEQAAYHHGEMSLQGTITSMAQDFIGSCNLNLLVPSGQFGTRNQGGNDKASARYIFTRLQSYTRKIFHPDDDPILDYLDEEGQSIEPKW